MKAIAVVALLTAGLIAPASFGQDDTLKERINEAIEAGVAAIQKKQAKEGHWQQIEGASKAGMTALCAWTLLEGGVSPKDPSVTRAAAVVRQECLNENRTYCLATAIFFLDRLGDPSDQPLIQALGVQLLAGQTSNRGWWYFCPR